MSSTDEATALPRSEREALEALTEREELIAWAVTPSPLQPINESYYALYIDTLKETMHSVKAQHEVSPSLFDIEEALPEEMKNMMIRFLSVIGGIGDVCLNDLLLACHFSAVNTFINGEMVQDTEFDDDFDDFEDSHTLIGDTNIVSEIGGLLAVSNNVRRQLFQEEEALKSELCHAGLRILEQIMEGGQRMSEGNYIELANIFKEIHMN